MVPDILRALENAERQGSEEVSGRQQSGRRPQGEARLAPEEVGHLLQLGNALRPEDALVHHELEGLAVFVTGVFFDQVVDGVEDRFPGLVFGFRVGYVRDLLTAGRNTNFVNFWVLIVCAVAAFVGLQIKWNKHYLKIYKTVLNLQDMMK